MVISEFEIFGLFGRFHHVIPIKIEDKITIIHGLNGFGKSTILGLIEAIFKPDYRHLRKINYSKIIIKDASGEGICIDRIVEDTPPVRMHKGNMLPVIKLKYSQIDENGRIISDHSPLLVRADEVTRFFPISYIEQAIPELERVAPRRWINRRNQVIYGLEDVVENYLHQLPIPDEIKKQIGQPRPPWLKEFEKSLEVYSIKTQRLFIHKTTKQSPEENEEISLTSAVQTYSQEISATMQENLAQSVAIAQKLDQTFPTRLFKDRLPDNIHESQLRLEYQEQVQKRSRLMDSGILDSNLELDLPDRELHPEEMKVLWIYLKDVEEKLRVFDAFLSRLETFREIINSQFSYKTIRLDRKKGFVFTSKEGLNLNPVDLSSGEQHEIVLFYELLFKMKDGSLVLIDEPELSLHVSWQQSFLENISKVATQRNSDFIIATHSPQIINNRWDLTIELKGE